jgi:hypothetical protein
MRHSWISGVASIGMKGGFVGSAYEKYWEFRIDRLSGDATLTIAKAFAYLMRKPGKKGTTAYIN